MIPRKLYRHVAVSAAILAATGCGDAPLATQPGEVLQLERGEAAAKRDKSKSTLVKRTVSLDQNISVSTEVTPDGGVLSIPQAGLRMYFPEGAVDETIVVTATALKGNRVAYDFQPHGTEFNVPVYVIQAIVNTELNTPRALKKGPDVWAGYLYNGSNDITADGSATFSELFDAFLYGKGNETQLYFATTHFSGYAFASGMKPVASGLE